ncbi:beta-lactamase family protein [Psychrosphaera sp. F3M07]|uniref:serine hydrolase domain-containing protein n=1 Tax=Psychrosphaera sp. F3M07 TaxID=2841560 RepID=UPI001C081A50|nr:serine hydrolase domain-containing protein [Psychrosphaera sp. F3M07]MBU2917076.1 beta-lactamase family protein [Psychrosphaera sp. F3M07]
MKSTYTRLLLLLVLCCVINACSKHQQTTHIENTAAAVVNVVAQYQEPEGWIKSVQGSQTIFIAPEKDLSLVVVAVMEATDAEGAALKAWKTYNPEFSREVRVNSPEVKKGGWDAIRTIEYQTSISEEMLAYAGVYKLGEQWQVLLIDGNYATYAKRAAAVRAMSQSFEIAGYKPEDLTKRTAQKLSPDKIAALLSFVEESAKALNIPGVGVAVIEDGKVLYEGGVGIKNIATQQPVTKDTAFMVASNTKGMTTLLLAKLVEMGKLNWDDQVINYYPDFKLGDEKTTQSVLIKHLVCACTGLPRKDLDWIFNSGPNVAASVTFTDLANTTPTSSFGELFQYNNQMAAAAGYVAAHILYPEMEIGAAYDKAMQQYIFDPLQMKHTTFSFAQALANDAASPHGLDLVGNTQLIPQTTTTGFNHTVTPYRPAGAAWSTPSDMIKYVQNELSEGVAPNGKRLFSAESVLKRRESTVATGADTSYGMGLSTKKVGGIGIVEHGGSLAGYLSNFIAIPSAKVGAVILTNSDEGYALLKPFTRRMIELLYDAETQAQSQVEVTVETNALIAGKLREEVTYPPDPNVVTKLASLYSSPELGSLKVTQIDGEVVLDPGVWKTAIASKVSPDGSVSLVTIAPFFLGLELVVGESAGLSTLSLIDAQHTYTFTEVKER